MVISSLSPPLAVIALVGALAGGCLSAGRSSAPGGTDTANGDGGGVSTPRILMFVAYNGVWWAEYKVLYEALSAVGYEVDVRSSASGYAISYQTDGDVQTSADALGGSSYAAFTSAFAERFGTAWDGAWNAPDDIPLDGRIQDVTSMSGYDAFVFAGGSGAVAYRYDGSYSQTDNGGHLSTAAEVQAAAEKINALVLEALAQGKPVLSQCHGATLLGFVRQSGTEGLGPDGLGTSILAGGTATGYPLGDGDTAAAYASLGVTYLISRPFVIDGPDSLVLTSRDWYPQTVAHASAGVLNVLGTYPSDSARTAAASVLVLHGGPVDTGNCGAGNRLNDVPCNYGTAAAVLPADHVDLEALLEADSANDDYSITSTGVDLMGGGLPFDPDSTASVRAYLDGFDAVVVFKHWNDGFTDAIQTAILEYADDGGGVVGLHHALYNDTVGGRDKNILAQQLFGAESAAATWSARNPDSGPYAYMSTNYGHFVSSFGVDYDAAATAIPGGFPSSPAVPNSGGAGLPSLALTDEIYLNMAFTGTPVFGSGVGEIELLFANDYTASPDQVHTAGFAKRFDASGDSSSGRLVFLEPGERKPNFDVSSAYGQIIRNAVVWAAAGE